MFAGNCFLTVGLLGHMSYIRRVQNQGPDPYPCFRSRMRDKISNPDSHSCHSGEFPSHSNHNGGKLAPIRNLAKTTGHSYWLPHHGKHPVICSQTEALNQVTILLWDFCCVKHFLRRETLRILLWWAILIQNSKWCGEWYWNTTWCHLIWFTIWLH